MGSECNLHLPQAEQQQAGAIAPFVAKTFHMVSDPATDAIVCWGVASNTFLVLDPAAFSDYLLPSYFKHRNFASFVRQLNTYGFRKVDTDRWEFAHESFLRGQAQLLPLIVRKKKKPSSCRDLCEEGEEVRGTIKAVQRLREEQRGMEEELQAMDRRLQAAETRPGQMMAFLAKLADDPGVVLRAMIAKKEKLEAAGGNDGSPESPGKRRRIGGVEAGRGDCGGVAGGDVAAEMVPHQGRGGVEFPFSVLGQVFY
ncbi:hypothetical protein QOZ80_1AG0032130 [Eleusine coracana subsp. coracana]|nr:hypothetical protein QOZ80_1AG0032130 [Eleusine coracana subsp. coracana]